MAAMTHQSPAFPVPPTADAGRQIAQLRQVLALVAQIAGRPKVEPLDEAGLDEQARMTGAYDHAAPIVQRRFDALVSETAIWAAAGVEALLAAHSIDNKPQAAAARLAGELETALDEICRLLCA